MSNQIINILMERDGLDVSEAEELVDEVSSMLEDCNYDANECERIMAEELGLELDYVLDLIF